MDKYVKQGNLKQLLIKIDFSAGPKNANPGKRVVSIIIDGSNSGGKAYQKK